MDKNLPSKNQPQGGWRKRRGRGIENETLQREGTGKKHLGLLEEKPVGKNSEGCAEEGAFSIPAGGFRSRGKDPYAQEEGQKNKSNSQCELWGEDGEERRTLEKKHRRGGRRKVPFETASVSIRPGAETSRTAGSAGLEYRRSTYSKPAC